MEKEKISSMDELEQLFGGDHSQMDQQEDIILSQNLEGFASFFPEWDLHPVKKK